MYVLEKVNLHVNIINRSAQMIFLKEWDPGLRLQETEQRLGGRGSAVVGPG